MRRILFPIVLVICCVISGCSQSQQNGSKTETYIIPNSYFEFTGSEVDEAVKSCLELGNDFALMQKKYPKGCN